MTQKFRYVGNPDFHDGYIRQVSRNQDRLFVRIDGDSGKRYIVSFDGVISVESETPQDMMLYALAEHETDNASLRLYDFINWYYDEPETEESRSYLRIVAKSFTVVDSD